MSSLVTALHARMGSTVPPDIKKKLAKPLATEITRRAFVGLCQERTTSRSAGGKALHEVLARCQQEPSCDAYATCLLKALGRPPRS